MIPAVPTTAEILERSLARITAGYIFPERAVEVDAAIRRRLAGGEYEGLSGPALCEVVTAHLQEASPDKHLRLLWQDEPQSLEPAGSHDHRDFETPLADWRVSRLWPYLFHVESCTARRRTQLMLEFDPSGRLAVSINGVLTPCRELASARKAASHPRASSDHSVRVPRNVAR
jgi:hypothetical protein